MIILSFLIYFALQSAAHPGPSPSASTSALTFAYVRELPVAYSSDSCICPQLRSTWDILWSSLATIFICTWVSIHPNSPGPNAGRARIFLQRLELMIWAIVIPEMIIFWAWRQWLSARKLAAFYKEFGWSEVHGHFLQMGGFLLVEEEHDKGVLDHVAFRQLLAAGKIRFPRVSAEEINAFSKGDGLSKIIAVGQTSWFIAQCITRAAKGLAVTRLELITVAFAFLNALIYFLWWNKPLDSSSTIKVPIYSDLLPVSLPHTEDSERHGSLTIFSHTTEIDQDERPSIEPETPSDSQEENTSRPKYVHNAADIERMERMESEQIAAQDLTPSYEFTMLPENQPLSDTGVNNSNRRIERIKIFLAIIYTACGFLLSALYFIIKSILLRIRQMRNLGGELTSGSIQVPTFYASYTIVDITKSLSQTLAIAFIGVVFGAIHCAGWNIAGPFDTDTLIWRVNSGIILAYPSVCMLDLIIVIGSHHIWVSRGRTSRLASWIVNKSGLWLWRPLMMSLPIYLLARVFLLVEAFIALRHLPEQAFVQVEWTRLLPHI